MDWLHSSKCCISLKRFRQVQSLFDQSKVKEILNGSVFRTLLSQIKVERNLSLTFVLIGRYPDF